MSESLDAQMWERLLAETKNRSIIDFLNANSIAVTLLSEGDFFAQRYTSQGWALPEKYYSIPANSYQPAVATLEESIYYHGYWINCHWYLNVRDSIVSDLCFPEPDEYNRHLCLAMEKGISIGVHVRRGDFVSLGWTTATSFYHEAVTRMKSVFEQAHFFVFSDEPQWCREHAQELGFSPEDTVSFPDQNTGAKSFWDMYHMTRCSHLIISNSSFSYLAALLNQSPNKLVITPTEHRLVV